MTANTDYETVMPKSKHHKHRSKDRFANKESGYNDRVKIPSSYYSSDYIGKNVVAAQNNPRLGEYLFL